MERSSASREWMTDGHKPLFTCGKITMQNKFYKHIAKVTAVATVLSSVMSVMPARAALITSTSDVMTRVMISVTADHTITFTLPATIDFDRATQTDAIRIDFDETSGFTQSGTWVVGDFTFHDGTARTVQAVAQGAGTVDCTVAAGVDNVCVAIDTTSHAFTIKPSADYTASAAAATVVFTIDGTTADGTLINPSAAGSYATSVGLCDEVAACLSSFTSTHTNTLALGITDSDQVNVTATVDPSLTFDIDTGVAVDSDSAAPYTVALGTMTTGAVSTSDAGSPEVNMIGLDLNTNASGGAVVTVRSGSATGLCSTSVGTDCIEFGSGAMSAGTEDYGICVHELQSTSSGAAFVANANFTGDAVSAASGTTDTSTTCLAASHTLGAGPLTNAAQTLLSTTAPISGGRAEIFVKAAISGVTAAHSDYTDTLTFVATGTF